MSEPVWEELGYREHPSWYLVGPVARQKREIHRGLIRRWAGDSAPKRIFKTDLFEEGFGEDHLLDELLPSAGFVCGADAAYSVVRATAHRFPGLAPGLVVTDIRTPGLRKEAFDLIISTSTLDHFATRAEFLAALGEVSRLLRPGGRLILTLDNPLNPMYPLLRWYSRRRKALFPLGYSPRLGTLCRDLGAAGLKVEAREWIIHNPRGISTVVFLSLSRWLGRRAERPISFLLAAFGLLGRLPTRRFTACFQAVSAIKPAGQVTSPHPAPPRGPRPLKFSASISSTLG